MKPYTLYFALRIADLYIQEYYQHRFLLELKAKDSVFGKFIIAAQLKRTLCWFSDWIQYSLGTHKSTVF